MMPERRAREAAQHRARRMDVLLAEMREFQPLEQVYLARELVAAAQTQGLPFPHDVDGEPALRRARVQLGIALDS